MAIAAVALLAILLSSFTNIIAKNQDILCTPNSTKYVRHPIDCRRWFRCSSKPMVEMPRCMLGKRFSLKTSSCVAITDPNNDCRGFCVHKGDQYFIGETFMGQTVCDKCLCSDNRGTIICSNICKNATKCIRNEHIYGIGMYFLESDGCNTCKCKPKVGIVCTNMTCTVDKVFCFFGKNIYATGDSFVHPDGQRNCVCRIDGTAYCKFRNIKPVSSDPNKCLYMGKEYDIGDIFPFNDVCNMCECLAKGRYACSKWNCLENHDFGGASLKQTKKNCTYKGKIYRITEIFKDSGSCSVCSCLISTEVRCVKKNCTKLISIGKVHILSEKKKFCTYNGQKYKVAEVFLGDNGCSKCFCPASGKVKCVKKACSRLISVVHKSLPKKFCTYKGHEYRVAQVFLGDDGCSKCTCPVSGEVTCMKRTCVTIKEVVTTSTTTTTTTTTPIPFCMYNGYKYDKNDEFAGVDGCSKCSCKESGVVTCIKQICSDSNNTLVAAPPKTSCIYNERTYGEGEEFEGADGCSKCLCSGSGLVTCMKQVCTKSRNGQESRQKKTSSVCRYNGQIYIFGQTFTAVDKCNQCGCKANGNIVCTKTICPATTTKAIPIRKGDTSAICRYHGKIYIFGQTFISIDKCNQCSCRSKGNVECTQKICSPQSEAHLLETTTEKVNLYAECRYNGRIYIFGQTFPSVDKCNQCSCKNKGVISCGKKTCAPQKMQAEKIDITVECRYNGKSYVFGQTFLATDKCNQCSCKSKGKIVCAKEKCQENTAQKSRKSSSVCRYNGQVYIIGQIFVAIDKCNRCSCKPQGIIICTKQTCPPPQKEAYLTESGGERKINIFAVCRYKGRTYVLGETFTAEDKCNECSCKRKGAVICTKKPVCSPTIAEISVKCHYNGKTYTIGVTFNAADKCNKCTCKAKGNVDCTTKICVFSETHEISVKCKYGIKIYIVGETFPAADNCNKCSCKPKGIVECTKRICLSSGSQGTAITLISCHYNGKVYKFGQTFAAIDKCNQCACMTKGSVVCTKRICLSTGIQVRMPCHYNGKIYIIGQTFEAIDRCNQCTCKASGDVVCTEEICPITKITVTKIECHYNGKVYVIGQTFIAIDKCNHCTCKSTGAVVCTEAICPLPKITVTKLECHYNGKVYIIGKTFMAIDKCNQCTCKYTGVVLCTEKICPLTEIAVTKIECRYYGKVYIFGQTFIAIDKCNHCTCKSTGIVACTEKICSLSKTTVTKMECHYYGKVYLIGQTFEAVDKCNQCICKFTGTVLCTEKICSYAKIKECLYNGKIYVIGQTFIAIDKCNHCTCKSTGTVVCTEEICSLSKTTVTKVECRYEGKIYVIGQTFIAIDKCNQCTCKPTGDVLCTEKICPPTKITVTKIECSYNGKIYVIGQTFESADECNQCICKYTGAVICTEKKCPFSKTKVTKIECRYYGKAYIIGQTFEAVDKCNQCICKYTGAVVCTEKICPYSKITVTKVECHYDGKVYVIGQMFIAIDKCNQCTCKPSGDVLCSEKICSHSKTTVTKVECHYDGKVYVIGQTFIAIDKCNQCTCKPSGDVLCSEKICSHSKTTVTKLECRYYGKLYLIGQTFVAVDKCNRCTCKSTGVVVCSEKICPLPKTTVTKVECHYNGKVFVIGQNFISIDKCNQCTCKPSGDVQCTEKKCSTPKTTETKECRYFGKVYFIGQTFIAIDKCNQCTCKYTGAVVCTEKKCSLLKTTGVKLQCHYYGKVYIIGQTFIAIDKCNQCTCKPTGAIVCTEKSCAALKNEVFLSENTTPKIEILFNCHYNGKTFVFGQSFSSADRCNTCSCKNKGTVTCTKKLCSASKNKGKPKSSPKCYYHGKIYVIGQAFIAIDSCNQCSCKTYGKVVCSEKKCPSSTTPETTAKKKEMTVICRYQGHLYIFGQVFMTRDKCNKCSCKSKGKVKCTEKKCTSATIPETTTQKKESSEKCYYDGEIYILGQVFMAKDQCNQCGCKTKGKVECTLKKCPPPTTPATTTVECRYEKQVYMLGDIFIAVDKCNKCSCKAKGKVECTKLKCSLSTTTETTLKKIETLFKCFYNGQVHTFGEVFIAVDKCNKCSCKAKGKVECTKLECSLSTHPEITVKKTEALIKCYYNGEIHILGEVFVAVDKCNKCSCKDQGEIDCSKLECSPSTTPETTLKKIETLIKCYYNGEIHIIGEVFIAVDKCNKCSCKDNGEVDCTEKKCSRSTAPEITVRKIETLFKCYYNGKIHILGEAFIAVDKCNKCSCKVKGKIECTKQKCSPSTTPETTLKKIEIIYKCYYNGEVHIFGEVFVAVDKCNKCSCKAKGKVECTKLECSPSTTPETTLKKIETLFKCYYKGEVHIFGEVFITIDKCNKCSCKAKGKVECTKLKCSLSTHPETTPVKDDTSSKCHYNAEIYVIGQDFIAIDKCNKCSCKAKGKVVCSKKKCPSSSTPEPTKCYYNGKMYILEQIFVAVDKCNQCSCKLKGKVECTERKCSATTAVGATLKNDTSSKCEYNGRMYIVGKVFVAIDKCNNCSCKPKGEVDCTKKKCPVPTTPEPTIQFKEFAVKCYYNGKIYMSGQLFIAADKCNNCSCQSSGKAVCSEKKCPPSSTPETKEQKKTYLSETTKQKNETSGKCSYNGQVYMFGQIFIAIDKCNNCSCKSKEKVECSEKKCPPSTTPATTPQTNETSAKCSYHGQIYAFGQIFTAVDKCNNCSCKSKGKVECTEKKCLPSTTPETTTQIKENFFLCRYHGNVYIIGQTFTAEDKCNTCSCKSNRTITCTERKCTSGKSQGLLSDITTQKIDILIECNYSGKTYKFGQTFIAVDKCNQCTCKTKGNVTCTTKTCPPKTSEVTTTQKIDIFIECLYNGKTYQYGQTFLAVDKCNKCSCMTKGSIICSQKKCLSSAAQETTTQKIDIFVVCRYNGQIFKFGQTFTAIDKCNKCICKRKGNIVCTKNTCLSAQAPRSTTTAKPFKLHTNTVSCVYEGYVYTVHATFLARDGCNQCSCMYNGKVLCTKKPCSIFSAMVGERSPSQTNAGTKCSYHGKIYKITETFVAIDQCNSCECIFPGQVLCTHNICEQSKGKRAEAQASQINKYPIINLEMKCFYHGKIYKITETFISVDECNSCECIYPGRVICGQSICEETIVAKPMPNPSLTVALTCEYDGVTYKAGISFISADGCNKCRCTPQGKIACLKSVCPAKVIQIPPTAKLECRFQGISYKIGTVFVSKDGCSTCKCSTELRIMCSDSFCIPKIEKQPTTTVPLPVVTSVVYCKHDGAFYRFGRIFHAGDGCNLCGCSLLGKVICTKKSCNEMHKPTLPPFPLKTEMFLNMCFYKGRLYNLGSMYTSEDGCVRCVCRSKKSMQCKKNSCANSGKSKASVTVMCKSENACYSVDSIFITIDGCSSCRCQKSGKVRCTKICGWKSKKGAKKRNLVKCVYEMKVYYAGARFLSKEGCKTCFCLTSGSVYCTSGNCKEKPRKKLTCTGEQAKKMTSSWYALEGQ